MMGRVHSIQTMGTVDGPGVRFVLFLQGCPLRCDYCHNPDTFGEQEEAFCFADSKELAEKANRYRAYYGKLPGVTVSGGEALLQQEFVTEFFTECKKFGFHTALDTAGSLPASKKLLKVTDLCLLDVKYASEEAYQRYTKGSLMQTISFLSQLEENKIETIIRQVIVPKRNDSEEAIKKLWELICDYSCVKKVELLPFRKLCIEKYEALGLDFPLRDVSEASEEMVNQLQKQIDVLRMK